MSIETPSWKTGAVQASVSRRAIVLRVEVSLTTSTSPSGARAAPRRRGGRRRLPTGAFSTSSATMRPSGPGARERREVDPSLARDPPRQRRCLDAAAAGRGGRR